ncbi:hypothetical protein [Halobacillus litoralis]|uniref:Uncharacterized protein n=1 Tax=Halobacillus litoralis TaxID=45668 RepID=A0A410MAX8_9BACI|nr:hypothetical protein [Halobacillus litoralis]QAS51833.1 hypothetical protein HLI_06080 [Halobacillus litoralis]
MNPYILKSKPIYEKAMSQLSWEEQTITMILFEVGSRVRVDALTLGRKDFFLVNVKYTIKKMKTNGSDWYPSRNQVRKTIKKLNEIGFMKIDDDGLPLWFYKDIEYLLE